MMHDWPGMWGYGFGHWIFFILAAAAILYPLGRILGRLGVSPFWSILVFIPFFNLVGLWVLAFIDWPKDAR